MDNQDPDIIDANGKRQIASHFYPMITKNTTTLMDSKDCLYIGGNATGRLYSTSGERLTNPEAYAHTRKPIYNNRRARGVNLNARTGQFLINNTLIIPNRHF